MIEQTLSIIKPDAVERNLEDKIKSFYEKTLPITPFHSTTINFII